MGLSSLSWATQKKKKEKKRGSYVWLGYFQAQLWSKCPTLNLHVLKFYTNLPIAHDWVGIKKERYNVYK